MKRSYLNHVEANMKSGKVTNLKTAQHQRQHQREEFLNKCRRTEVVFVSVCGCEEAMAASSSSSSIIRPPFYNRSEGRTSRTTRSRHRAQLPATCTIRYVSEMTHSEASARLKCAAENRNNEINARRRRTMKTRTRAHTHAPKYEG